ncbi:MAG: trans-aconitate 2-methyltransferase [Candidatus Nanohaloarchaea archaeon]
MRGHRPRRHAARRAGDPRFRARHVRRVRRRGSSGRTCRRHGLRPRCPVRPGPGRSGFDVTGVDIAADNIAAARQHVPDATFARSDFSTYAPDQRFDGLLCLFALFHVPRTEHGDILAHFHDLLAAGAPMLITVGTADIDEMTKEFGGAEMVWSFFDAEHNRDLITDAGFTIDRTATIPDRLDGSDHLWVLATA